MDFGRYYCFACKNKRQVRQKYLYTGCLDVYLEERSSNKVEQWSQTQMGQTLEANCMALSKRDLLKKLPHLRQ